MPMGTLTVLAASPDRQALIPMAAGYLILMPTLALGLRRLYRPPATQPSPEPSPGPSSEASPGPGPADSGRRSGRAALARHVGSTVIGGYLLLMAVVVAYYYAVARVGPAFLESAATGTALLIGLAAPVFAAASWLTGRRGRASHPVSPAAAGEDLLPRRAASSAQHPLMGYLAWAVLFGALFAFEGLALAGVSGVPALSDVVRAIMRYPAGRWVLFALWLWAGWRIFFRSQLAEPVPSGPAAQRRAR
jgi:hypothetical protein